MSQQREDTEATPENENFPKRPRWALYLIAGASLSLVLCALILKTPIRARSRSEVTACKSNLKNIGYAMEMYSQKHGGRYPSGMAHLTPNYLKTIPECPLNGSNAYQMWVGADAPGNTVHEDYFYVRCTEGHSTKKVPPGYPAYNGVVGLIERAP